MKIVCYTKKNLKNLIEKARADEREKCSQFCDALSKLYPEKIGFDVGYTMAAKRAATGIRNQVWKES